MVCNAGEASPCEHNGGVKVVIHHNPFVTAQGRRSISYTRQTWVWPEQAHLYQ
jgi:hypothetical protein